MSVPLWLFTGPELGERNEAVEALRKTVEKKYGQLDSHVFYAADTSLTTVLDTIQNGALFADARFAVVRKELMALFLYSSLMKSVLIKRLKP